MADGQDWRKTSEMKVAAYYRVSTTGQGDGYGIHIQRKHIEEYCAKNGMEVVAEYYDIGFSGASLHRPDLYRMIYEDSLKKEWEAVVVFKWDRLARDPYLDGKLRFDLKEANGASVLSATEPNGADPISELTQVILAAAARYERKLIAARMAWGRKMKRKSGGYPGGQVPYGWEALKDGTGNLTPHKREQIVVAWIVKQRQAGKGYRTIAHILNRRGVPGKRGGRWRFASVKSILTRGY